MTTYSQNMEYNYLMGEGWGMEIIFQEVLPAFSTHISGSIFSTVILRVQCKMG